MFTVGTVDGKMMLVACCDFCSTVVEATRDEQGQCILPDGWIRVGDRKQVGNIGGDTPVYRSTLMCPECQKPTTKRILEAYKRVYPPIDSGIVGESKSATVREVK